MNTSPTYKNMIKKLNEVTEYMITEFLFFSESLIQLLKSRYFFYNLIYDLDMSCSERLMCLAEKGFCLE